jgi:F0F1-type ATP synthase assembly protein I
MARKPSKRKSRRHSSKKGGGAKNICMKLALSFIISFITGLIIGVIGAFFHLPPYFVGIASGTFSGASVVLIFGYYGNRRKI